MTDGTRIGLGAGEYIIAAEVPLDMFDGGPWGLPDDPLGSMPVGMNVSVEVVAGDDARITRPGGAVTLIAKGNIGLYAGGGTVDVTRAGPVATLDRSPQPAPAPPAPSLPQVSGVALEASGMPTVMASVFMRNVVRGAGEVGFAPTGSDGRFTITTAAACERDFAIVLALPSQLRNDLAEIKPPQVVPLLRQGGQAQLERPLRFDFSAPLLSSVADPSGLPVAGVLVEACVVDEVFGALFVLGLRAVTDANGQFQISRLPARLPAHQRLSVLLIHDDYEVACVSVPTRGDVAATAAAGPMQLQPLSEVRFFGLPPNSVHTVLQELGDAPSSVVAVRRTVTADFFGRVSPVRFGAGRMWLVDGPSGDLRALVEDGTLQGVPRFRPDGDAVARDKWFRRLQQLGDTKVVVASSYRHEEVLLDLGADAVSAPVLRVVDVQGHAVSEAQVFAVSGQGPRDSLDVRFVGLSNANGIVSLAGVLPEEGLVVLGANKAVGWLAAPVLAVGGANITLQPPGSVVLGAALRPAPAAVERRVVVRFERYGADLLPGLRPDVVRFACDENQWMVGDVPPGEYRVQVGDHVFEQVVVPPLDWVVIQ